jgi:predicted RNA binding protein YcfA (HicA-like mRNA interferase family)
MKLPRDVNAAELVRALHRIGYERVRQTGSHIILRCESPFTHSLTVPNHRPIRVGTLSSILAELASQRSLTVEEAWRMLEL